MKTGTYKLVRIKNHYHVAGETCHHTGRRKNTPNKRQKSLLKGSKPKSRAMGFMLVSWAIIAAIYATFSPAVLTYAKETETVLTDHIAQTDKMVTPEEQYQILEAIKTQAFEIRKQLEVHRKFETASEVREYVLAEAKKAGVHVEKFLYIAEKESQFNPNAVGDLDVICTNPNSPYYKKPVYSRGVFQFSRCWYSSVTDEQAFDVEFSTKLALSIIANSKKDCISQFSTCRAWHKKMGTL